MGDCSAIDPEYITLKINLELFKIQSPKNIPRIALKPYYANRRDLRVYFYNDHSAIVPTVEIHNLGPHPIP